MTAGMVDESDDGVIEKLAGYRWWRLEFDAASATYRCEVGLRPTHSCGARLSTPTAAIERAIELWERTRR